MIPQIIRHIENSSELSAEFQKLTEVAYDERELAEIIKDWFERRYENDVCVEPTWEHDGTKYGDALYDLFESILQQAIVSISSEGWQTIAQHLWQKYWTQKTADRMGYPH